MFCSNCGCKVEDDSNFCSNCGYKLKLHENQEFSDTINSIVKNHPNDKIAAIKEYRSITNCTLVEATNIFEPIYNGKNNPDEIKKFEGIYRYSFLHGQQEVYCPRCHSENCSHYQEQKIIPGKKKTRYTANLNPLHPFTLVNKKEKVIREDKMVTESKFICNSCGKIFQ